MSQPDENSAGVDAGFREETRERTLYGVRVTCGVGIALFLSFGLLDVYVYPDHAGYFLLLRIVTALGFAFIALLSKTGLGDRFPSALGVLAYLWIATVIIEMVLATGGGSSPYYAGLILVLLGMGVLMPWGWSEATLTGVMIFAGYALACIAVGPLSVPGVFINNLFFLFGGAAFGARQN